jgi:hypothetical protein
MFHSVGGKQSTREEREHLKGLENIIYDEIKLYIDYGWLRSNAMHSKFNLNHHLGRTKFFTDSVQTFNVKLFHLTCPRSTLFSSNVNITSSRSCLLFLFILCSSRRKILSQSVINDKGWKGMRVDELLHNILMCNEQPAYLPRYSVSPLACQADSLKKYLICRLS